MNRRGFLGSILALAAAPAIVRADSLMRIVPMETIVYRRPIPFLLTPEYLRQFVRRTEAYDVRRDQKIIRLDVMHDGGRSQSGVDLLVTCPERVSEETGLQVLAEALNREGAMPVPFPEPCGSTITIRLQ